MTDQLTPHESDDIIEQFERLMDEVLHADLKRACFRPWEIAILVDIASCSATAPVLRAYRIAVQHQLRNGTRVPMTLSEYMAIRPKNNLRESTRVASARSKSVVS